MGNHERAKTETGEDLSYEMGVLRDIQQELGISDARENWKAADKEIGHVGAKLALTESDREHVQRSNGKVTFWLIVISIALAVTWIGILANG